MSLKTDFKNDKFAGKRKYAVTENGDGTVSFDDVTEYETVGDISGATEVNAVSYTHLDVYKRQDRCEIQRKRQRAHKWE